MSNLGGVFSGLTRYPLGSVREVLAVSFPLMLMAASGCLMHFCDRVILAHYSIEAMNIAVAASMPIMTFQFGLIAIAAIAEVFVGQYNGAGHKNKLGAPVWQMVYFGLMTGLVFLPLGYFGTPWLLPNNYLGLGTEYLSILLYGVPLSVLIAALSCFFIGQGQVLVVTLMGIIANALNIALAYLFVFGYEPYFSAMGLNGAAWALNICLLIETIGLWLLFLRPVYRKVYGTGCMAFNKPLFMECLKLGIPSSLGHLVELIGWSVVVYMVAGVSEAHATVYNTCHILWILFSFVIEGLNKSVVALSANALGAHRFDLMPKIYRSAIFLSIFLFGGLFLMAFIFDQTLLQLLVPQDVSANLMQFIEWGLRLVIIALLFDAMAWVSAGMITAAKDTRFVMFAGTFNTWFFAVLPVYYAVIQNQSFPLMANVICVGFSIMNAFIYYLRYRSRRWDLKSALIEP